MTKTPMEISDEKFMQYLKGEATEEALKAIRDTMKAIIEHLENQIREKTA